jgi:hypothetical protein
MIKISPSGIRKQLHCEYAAYAEYVEGLAPLLQDHRFAFGKAVHALLEFALRLHWAGGHAAAPVLEAFGQQGEQIARESFAAMHDDDGTTVDEQTAIDALAMVRWVLPRMELDKWETLTIDGEPAVEVMLERELLPDVVLCGKLDWLARHKQSGDVFVVDHKTSKGALSPDELVEHDLQLALYRWLADAPGRAAGGMLHKMRRHPPKTPALLKKGDALSRAAIASDWPTYLAALRAHGFDPADYAEQQEKLEGACFHGFFRDVTSDRSRRELVGIAQDVGRRLHQLHERVGDWPLRNRSLGCSGCDFKAWCDASLDGLHPGSLVGLGYSLRKDSPWRDATASNNAAAVAFEQRLARAGPFDSRFVP